MKTKPDSRKAAAPPKISHVYKPEDVSLEEWQRTLRRQFGAKQNFVLRNVGAHHLFSDFSVTNPESQKTYKVAIRGDQPGMNYCSCPDFQINNLGTCKHIEFALAQLSQQPGAQRLLENGWRPRFSEVWLSYGLRREIRFRPGRGFPAELADVTSEFFDSRGVLREERFIDFPGFLDAVSMQSRHEVRCYDDVLAYVAERQDAAHRQEVVAERLAEGIDSPLFDGLLKTELYPYQREGALFAVQAGRSLVGDDMGLGKTIQAIAAAELMAAMFTIEKALIISPTSLKYQWKTEIEKFSDRTAQVVEGLNAQRRELYSSDSFYKLINYELVARDIAHIREWAPDLIILDEAQRIKNWKTRTAKVVKELESSFAIVLTGTPIENRIEELHSLMEFVDRRRLGPLYRFVHTHRITDAGGKVVGYKDLDKVRQSLQGVMIRRKKRDVLTQLPERIDQNFLVPLTPEQEAIHEEYKEIVTILVAKWRRYKFLCDADQRRMQIALAMMRMAADNTYLVDHVTVHGPKIEELEILLNELVVEGGEKAVVFSQWLRMTELVENMLRKNGIGYAHLNGGIPSRNRGALMKRFKDDPDCKVFLSTDAGGVGLNLQSGSVVVNMDIPWNPAILEQRIGRVHRMGQNRTVRVVNFVSRASIEERILDLLRFKKSLFEGAMDENGADVVMAGEGGMAKLINAVEDVVTPLASPDFARERQELVEEKADEEAAVKEGELDEEGLSGAAARPVPPVRPDIKAEVPMDAAAKTDVGVAAETGAATAEPESKTGSAAAPEPESVDAGVSGDERQTGSVPGGATRPGAGNGEDALQALLAGGAQFLMSLSSALAPPAGARDGIVSTSDSPSKTAGDGMDVLQKVLHGAIERDSATGKSYLKIAMPEPDTMNRIVAGIGQLLSGLLKR